MNVLFQSRRGWPRFSIAEIMAAIAAIAFAVVWPVASLPVCSGILIVLLHRAGFTLLGLLIIAGVLGLALGLALPLIVQR